MRRNFLSGGSSSITRIFGRSSGMGHQPSQMHRRIGSRGQRRTQVIPSVLAKNLGHRRCLLPLRDPSRVRSELVRFFCSTGFQPVPSGLARVENPCYTKDSHPHRITVTLCQFRGGNTRCRRHAHPDESIAGGVPVKGSVNRNAAPPPGRLAAVIVPPCASTIPRARSPAPAQCRGGFRSGGCGKISRTRASLCPAASPVPDRPLRSRSLRHSSSRAISIGQSAGVYSSALSIRFISTCSINTPSICTSGSIGGRSTLICRPAHAAIQCCKRRADHFLHRQPFLLDDHSAGFHARHVEQVVDQPLHPVGFRVDGLE